MITGDHVFGPEVHECTKVYPGDFLDVSLIALGYRVGQRVGTQPEQSECQKHLEQTVYAGGCLRTPAAVKQG